jgi:hypothetical protein
MHYCYLSTNRVALVHYPDVSESFLLRTKNMNFCSYSWNCLESLNNHVSLKKGH